MNARSHACRASRQDKARRRWPTAERAPAGRTPGKLGMEVKDQELTEVYRRGRSCQGPTA